MMRANNTELCVMFVGYRARILNGAKKPNNPYRLRNHRHELWDMGWVAADNDLKNGGKGSRICTELTDELNTFI